MQLKSTSSINVLIVLSFVIMTVGLSSAADLSQWASGATASSEYSASGWSANKATGAPDTAKCGDVNTAWAPSSSGSDPEWLKLSFTTPVLATGIRVHETYNAGSIYQVDLVDTSGQSHTVWTGTDSTACPGWFEITFPKTEYAVNGVILHTKIAGWEEIDTVELIGDTDTTTVPSSTSGTSTGTASPTNVGVSPRQWASGATASSEYSASGWSANQAAGAPIPISAEISILPGLPAHQVRTQNG